MIGSGLGEACCAVERQGETSDSGRPDRGSSGQVDLTKASVRAKSLPVAACPMG